MSAAHRHSGFTLVEIALSLGVIAFALTAIFGLLTIGVNSGRSSLEDTVLATMTNEIVSEMRQQSFAPSPSAPVPSQPTPPPLPGTDPATPLGLGVAGNPTTLPVMYFDDSGARLKDYSSTPPQDYASAAAAMRAGAIYQCTATLLPDRVAAAKDGETKSGTLGKTDAKTGLGQVNLVNVTLVFRWPVVALSSATPPSSTAPQNGYRSIQVSLARY